MKRQGIFFIFLFSCHISQAAVIKGTLPQYAGETVNVFLFEDYFVLDEAGKATIFDAYNFKPSSDLPKLLRR